MHHKPGVEWPDSGWAWSGELKTRTKLNKEAWSKLWDNVFWGESSLKTISGKFKSAKLTMSHNASVYSNCKWGSMSVTWKLVLNLQGVFFICLLSLLQATLDPLRHPKIFKGHTTHLTWLAGVFYLTGLFSPGYTLVCYEAERSLADPFEWVS